MNPKFRRVVSLLTILVIGEPIGGAATPIFAVASEQPAHIAVTQVMPIESTVPAQFEFRNAHELSVSKAIPSPILQAQQDAAQEWVHANWDGANVDRKANRFVSEGLVAKAAQKISEGLSEDDYLPDRLRMNGRQPRRVSQQTLAQPSFVNSEYTYINGTVRAEDTRLPISNVYVQAYDQRGQIEDYDQTDRQGHFSLIVSRGKYLIHYDSAEVYPYYFASEWYDSQATKVTAQVITATGTLYAPSDSINSIDAILAQGAQVSGTILASNTGQPVTNTKLVIYDETGYIINRIDVDDNGHYLSSGLASGQYHLCAYNSQFQLNYVRACSNSLSALKTYPTITVTAPDLMTNVNISLSVGALLSGVVSAIDTGTPLNNIGVYLFDLDGQPTAYTYTNDLGTYELSGIPSGTYTLYFSTSRAGSPGWYYFSEFYNQKDSEKTADPVTLLAPQAQRIDYVLNRGAFIVGRVTAKATGDPLPRVEVYATRVRDGAIVSYPSHWSYTDSQGYYLLTVRPGAYALAYDTRYSDQLENYCSQYWDGSSTFSSNVTITTTRNTTQTFDVALASAGGIAGRLTASDTGLAVYPATVFAWFSGLNKSDFDTQSAKFHQTRANGQYDITGLCGSGYKLGFNPPLPYAWSYYNHELRYDHATIIPNTRGFTTQIDSTVEPAGQITGVIRSERDGKPIEGARVLAVPALGQFNNIYFGSSRTDSQGRYQLWLPAANYRLWFYASPDYCDHYNAGATTLTQAPPLLLRSGEYLPNNNAILTWAVVTGTVLAKDSGQPLPYVFVYDVPLDPELISADSSFTDSNGQFSLYGLCRGRHTLGFLPTSYISTTYQYAKQYYGGQLTKETADVITITNSTTQTVQANLDRGVVVSGHIQYSDFDGYYPVPVIAVYDENGNYVTAQYAESDGSFALRLPRGRLKISALDSYASNIASQFFDHKNDLDSANIVDTRATDIITGVNFLIGPGSAITGTITDADTGLPVQRGTLSVYDPNHANYLISITSLDSQGRFTTTARLPSGQYKLKVTSPGYVAGYFGNAKDFANASVITVSSGITTSSVQIAVLPLLSSQNLVFRAYMPVVPHTPAPILYRVPTITPSPQFVPTATPTRVVFPTPVLTRSTSATSTVVFGKAFHRLIQ